MTILEYIKLLRGRDFVTHPVKESTDYTKLFKTKEEYIDFQWQCHRGMRSSAILNTLIFRSGDCWRFALLIKAVFPEAKAHLCWNEKEALGHVIVEYQDKFYDITGEVDMSDWHIDEADLDEAHLHKFTGFVLTTATKILDNFYYTPQERKDLKERTAHACIDAIKLVDSWDTRLQNECDEYISEFRKILDESGSYLPYEECASHRERTDGEENNSASNSVCNSAYDTVSAEG